MPSRTPLVFREAGVDPTLDEIPLKRANMKPVLGCAAIMLIGCAVSFFLVAGMSYANGRKAAQEAAALIPSEYAIPTGSPTSEVTPEVTPETTIEITDESEPVLIVTRSLTDTPPAPEITDQPYPTAPPQSANNSPVVVQQKQYVYITQPAPAPVIVTRQIAVTRRVVVTGQPIIITAPPTATATATDEPEVTPEITPEVTAEITDEPTATPTATLTETPTATETLTEIPTLTETPTETATHTPTLTETPSETPTLLPIPTDLPTATFANEKPTAGPTWDGTQTYALDN